MKKKIIFIFIFSMVSSFLKLYAIGSPMEGWFDYTGLYTLSNQYREQDGYALVLGKKIHYWLYDTLTNKLDHNGDTSVIYNRIIPSWVEKMGYVIDYDNITIINPNEDLATSVRTLMKQRGADISVALITSNNYYTDIDYVVINEYFPKTNSYKTTIYYLYE